MRSPETASLSAPLPPAFDPATYLAENLDLGPLTPEAAAAHYAAEGRAAGRVASPAARREGLLALIEAAPSILEIGPFCRPLLRGPHVEYLDVLTPEQLRDRALSIGMDPAGCPEVIHHIGDLAQVNRRYAAVVSSHAIEHQPDLVRHLNDVARILEPEGAFYLLIPDKRFCFDHFIAESTIPNVLQAHHERRRVHTLASVIEHDALTTHNDSERHWQGDSTDPNADKLVERVQNGLRRHAASAGGYVDVHAWYFTPQSFRTIVDTLAALELIDLEVAEVYDSVTGRNEFAAVLRLDAAASARAAREPIAESQVSGGAPALVAAPPAAPRIDRAEIAISSWRQRTDRPALPAHHQALAAALDAGDAAEVAAMLGNLGAVAAGQGILGGAQQQARARDPIFAARRAQETVDALAALATSLGVSPGRRPADTWAAIAEAVGAEIAPPPHIGGHLGVPVGDGQSIHLRMIEALQAALRLRQLARRRDRIIEVGGGAGLTAWYAHRLDLLGVETAADPITGAIQSYVLGTPVPPLPALTGKADLLFSHELWPADVDFAATLAALRPDRILLLRHAPESAATLAAVAERAGYHLHHRHPDWLRAGHQELLFGRA